MILSTIKRKAPIKVAKAQLKAKMLEYFRRVEQSGEPLIVTSHNVPALEVRPIRQKRSPNEVFADIRGKLKYRGDLTETTLEEWQGLDL